MRTINFTGGPLDGTTSKVGRMPVQRVRGRRVPVRVRADGVMGKVDSTGRAVLLIEKHFGPCEKIGTGWPKRRRILKAKVLGQMSLDLLGQQGTAGGSGQDDPHGIPPDPDPPDPRD